MKGSHFIFDTKCLDRDHIYGVQLCLFQLQEYFPLVQMSTVPMLVS